MIGGLTTPHWRLSTTGRGFALTDWPTIGALGGARLYWLAVRALLINRTFMVLHHTDAPGS